MGEYQVVAQATSLAGLKNVLTTMKLNPGDKVLVTMDLKLPMGWAFDAAGAELLFKPLMPDHMNLIDVWGEDSVGYVEMEATSPPLAAVLAFISNHWLAILIAGAVIAALVFLVTVSVKTAVSIAQTPTWVVASLVIAGIALLGLAVYKGVSSGKVQYQLKQGETYLKTSP